MFRYLKSQKVCCICKSERTFRAFTLITKHGSVVSYSIVQPRCFSLSPIITKFIMLLVFHKQFIALKDLLFGCNNARWLGLYSIMLSS